jgi:hypothetical protein
MLTHKIRRHDSDVGWALPTFFSHGMLINIDYEKKGIADTIFIVIFRQFAAISTHLSPSNGGVMNVLASILGLFMKSVLAAIRLAWYRQLLMMRVG